MTCPVSINGVAIRPGRYVAGMLNDAAGKDGIVKEITLGQDGEWTIVVARLPKLLSVWYAKESEVYCFTKRPSQIITDAANKATWESYMDRYHLMQAVKALAATGR